MRHFKPQLEFFTQLHKPMQQCHRIWPAGDRDEDAIAAQEQVMFLDEVFQLGKRLHKWNLRGSGNQINRRQETRV